MTALETLAERVVGGEAVTEADAQVILEAHDLITIGTMGDDVRRRRRGIRTTFVRVFEIHVDAPPAALPPRLAAGEFRIVGRPASLEAAVAATRGAAALAGAAPLSGFSLADLDELGRDNAGLGAVCNHLREAGLELVADAPLDLFERPEDAILAARAAGLGVLRLTVHNLSDHRRAELVARARDLQMAVGGFQAFAPLPDAISHAAPSTGYDDVKQIALARLVAANIETIQVDWVRYGPKLAQVGLTVGADDVDGVAAVDPGILGTRRSPIEEIRTNIRSAGLEPVERNGRFELPG